MRVDQRELGAVVIETRIRPADRLMATVALLAVATLVVVFAAVAVDATLFEHVLEVRLTVAVSALQSCVRVFQGELGFSMIEPNAAPRRSRVTILTGRAVCTGMHVVDAVATRTAPRCSGKLIVTVTVSTGNETVVSRQPVACQVMVKLDILPV